MRKCLAEEFSSIYLFLLRGNQRTSGELSRKEGGKIFGSGSRAPIAISLLVKNPEAKECGKIYFHDIGDYLSREEKLEKIAFGSTAGVSEADGWKTVLPDEHGGWLNQRDDSFKDFVVLGNKASGFEVSLFENYSSGVKTNRDAWVYNSSRSKLVATVKGMVGFYNSEVDRYRLACKEATRENCPKVDAFLDFDSTKISWTREVKYIIIFRANGTIMAAVGNPVAKPTPHA